MHMKQDYVQQYISLRQQLLQEKQELQERLQRINEAIGAVETTASQEPPAARVSPAAPPAAPAARSPKKRGRRGGGGGLNLRDAVLKVTAARPLTKEQILQEIERLGYRFSTNNPLNSLGTILYGKNPRFRNEGGRFSPLGGSATASAKSTSAKSPAPAKRGRPAKRTMTDEGRARIAAAQRARWARVHAGR